MDSRSRPSGISVFSLYVAAVEGNTSQLGRKLPAVILISACLWFEAMLVLETNRLETFFLKGKVWLGMITFFVEGTRSL